MLNRNELKCEYIEFNLIQSAELIKLLAKSESVDDIQEFKDIFSGSLLGVE